MCCAAYAPRRLYAGRLPSPLCAGGRPYVAGPLCAGPLCAEPLCTELLCAELPIELSSLCAEPTMY